jgi:hypothetical protein
VMYEKMKSNYKVLQGSMKQKEARIIFLRNNIQMLHNELEHLEAMDVLKEVQTLQNKIQSLERINTELQTRLSKIDSVSTNNNLHKNTTEKVIELSPTEPLKQRINTTNLSTDDLKNWWQSLPDEWKLAYNKAFLARGEITDLPSPEELKSILQTENIEIIGERILFGGFKRLTFKLSNLLGLSELTFISSINLSGHNIDNTNGLSHLKNLKSLNLTSNNLTTIGYSDAFKSIQELIVRDNLLHDLNGLERFDHLEVLDISDNSNLLSILELDSLERLEVLRIGYAPNLKKQIVRLKMMRPNIEVRDF